MIPDHIAHPLAFTEAQKRAWFDKYRPQDIPYAIWQEKFAPMVWGIVVVLTYTSIHVFQEDVWIAKAFLRWCDELGVNLDYETVLVPDLVSTYAGLQKRQKHHYGRLERMARAVTRVAPWPPLIEELPRRKKVHPYTVAETYELWIAAESQSSDRRRRTAITMQGLADGAGARTMEIVWAQARDLVDLAGVDGPLFVQFGEPYPRVVPVSNAYAPALRALRAGLDPGDYLHGRDPVKFTKVPGANLGRHLDHAYDKNRPHVHASARRFRQTWLLRLLNDGVPLADVWRAAGAITWPTIQSISELLEPSDDSVFYARISSVDPFKKEQ